MKFEFVSCTEIHALKKVEEGEAHLAIVTELSGADLSYKTIGQAYFKTYISKKHKLNNKKKIHVNELLKHSFVSPNNQFLGKVGAKQSLDGWRDDEFPRKITYLSSSLKVLENIVKTGNAVAYLPDYLGDSLGLEVLQIEGCPYSCQQKVRLVVRNPKELAWLDW